MKDEKPIPRLDEHEPPPPASTLAPRPSREDLERPDRLLEKLREAEHKPPTMGIRLEGPKLSFPLLVRKFAEVGLLASFLAAVLSYPLFFPPRINQWLLYPPDGEGWWASIRRAMTAVAEAFAPMFTGQLPVLELKSTAWLLTGLLVIAGWAAARLAEPLFGVEVLTRHPSQPERPRKDWLRTLPLIACGGFLVWTLVSISPWVGWAPSPPAESVLAEIPGVPPKTWTGHGGAYNSVVAWLQMAVAISLFFVMQDLIRTRRYAYKLIGLILGFGILAALTSVLLHVKFPPLAKVWIPWGPDEFRNDMGGFVGHNVALSAFLIAPLLLSFTLLLISRGGHRRWVSAGLISGIAVMSLAMLLAQSRAVIPILGVAFLVLIVLLMRLAAVRPRLIFYILVPVGGLLLLLSQMIDQEWNPLYRRNIPLASRLDHVTVEHLKTETRLRILVASLPIIRQHPLRGTGWGTFQYVYPKAQGEFYQQNPDTAIGPTNKRTQRAHNEYLQTLFESGIVGLGFALTALITVLMLGWRTISRSLGQRNIAIQTCLVVSILALLAHGLADFPLRVAPTAATLMVLLGIWSVSDRLWLIRVPPVSERAAQQDEDENRSYPISQESEMRPDLLEAPAPPASNLRFPAVAWLVATFALAGSFVIAATWAGNWFASETYLLQAKYKTSTALKPGENDLELLNRAMFDLERSLRLMPRNGAVQLEVANTLRALSSVRLQHSLRAQQAGQRETAETERIRAVQNANLGIEYLNRSLAEVRFHFSYGVRASLFHYLAYLSPNQSADYLTKAAGDFARAIETNPGDGSSIVTLLSLLEGSGRGSSNQDARSAKITELRALLLRYHPVLFEEHVMAPVMGLRYVFAFETAHELTDELIRLDPVNPRLVFVRMLTAYETQDLEAMTRYTQRVIEEAPETAYAAQARQAIQEGQMERALRLIRQAARTTDSPGEPTQVLAHLIRMNVRTGEGDEAERLAAQAELTALLERNPQNLNWMANFLLFDFKQPLEAQEVIERRLAIESPPPDIQTNLLLAMALAAKHGERLGQLPEKMQDVVEPSSPVTDVGTRQDLQRALTELTRVRGELDGREQRAVLDARIAQVRQWLGPEGEP